MTRIEDAPQFHSSDGCVYIYSHAEKRWHVLRPADGLPPDVNSRIRELKEAADALNEKEKAFLERLPEVLSGIRG